jgi:hypothetical protein
MDPPGSLLENDAPFLWFVPREGAERDPQIDLTLDVVFEDAGPAKKMPVLATLKRLTEYVFFNVILVMAELYEDVIDPAS